MVVLRSGTEVWEKLEEVNKETTVSRRFDEVLQRSLLEVQQFRPSTNSEEKGLDSSSQLGLWVCSVRKGRELRDVTTRGRVTFGVENRERSTYVLTDTNRIDSGDDLVFEVSCPNRGTKCLHRVRGSCHGPQTPRSPSGSTHTLTDRRSQKRQSVHYNLPESKSEKKRWE